MADTPNSMDISSSALGSGTFTDVAQTTAKVATLGSNAKRTSDSFGNLTKTAEKLDAALASIARSSGLGDKGSDKYLPQSFTKHWLAQNQSAIPVSSASGDSSKLTGVSSAFNRTKYAISQGQGMSGVGDAISAAGFGKAGGMISNIAAAGGGGAGGISGFLSGGGGTPAGGAISMIAQIGTQITQQIGKALDQRIQSGYQYSLPADKMAVMYQQTQGVSQGQYFHDYRKPMTNYRLGGGTAINDLLAVQARTGLDMSKQLSSVEAIRTASGYGYSAGDVGQMMATMGSAEVNNRMFMMTGTGMYGIGGKQNSMMDVMQSAVKAAGLTDKRIAATALQDGSASRMRLDAMGIPKDMQDMIIQYAQSNSQFQEKTHGGQGMYDPSKKSHRRAMGIEENFATQHEETLRQQTNRDENFYNRQKDNFADLERQTQTLTRVFGALEDKLSGIIGMKTSLGPMGKAAGKFGSGLGTGLMMAGSAMQLIPGIGTAAGLATMGVGAGLSIFSGFLGGGDPKPEKSTSQVSSTSNSDNMKIPSYSKSGTTVGQLKGSSSFNQMHPEMRKRLLNMIIASGGRVGVGQGVRSSAGQEAMFRSRYKPTNKKTDIFWNNTYWEHVSGAAAAPPGRSMHEIGLAADLVGDIDWVVKNAFRFGLKHFADVNDEPWHVQPKELPNGRSEYEKNGSPWGHGPAGSAAYDPNVQFGDEGSEEHPAGTGSSGGELRTYSGMSTADILERSRLDNIEGLGSGGAGGLDYRHNSATPTKALTGTLSGTEIVSLLKSVGFTGEDLVKAVGISHRESRWNPAAYNGDRSTGDASYGLFQINMIGRLGPARRQSLGLSKNEDLFDPQINARSAKKMVDASGWYPWGPYKGNSETNNVDMAAAAATVRAAENSPPTGSSSTSGGDPFTPSRGYSSGGSTMVVGDRTVTIAPTIHLHPTASMEADLQRIAKETVRLLEAEVNLAMLRRS